MINDQLAAAGELVAKCLLAFWATENIGLVDFVAGQLTALLTYTVS